MQGRLRLAAAQRAVSRFPTVRKARRHGLPGELIVNLTSYPARFPVLAATIKGLLDQTVRADRTILWIDHAHLDSLPADVRALERHGLEVRGCRDIRSFTKLVPALLAFPDAFHVTADDDLYYAPTWLEHLVAGGDGGEPAIVCWRAHLAPVQADGALAPYLEWEIDTLHTGDASDGRLLFPTGVGGILYPPGSLDPAVTDEAAFLRLCPSADDIWFFWMARRRHTPTRRVNKRFRLITWPEGEGSALFPVNLYQGGNDRQIRALEQAVGRVSRQDEDGLPSAILPVTA